MPDNNFENLRNQYVVYWEKSGQDSYGEPTLDSPVELKVLIEKVRKEGLNPQAETIAYDYLINVPQDLVEGSILWLGKLKDLPATPTGLLQVVDTENYVDDEGRTFDRWARVIRYSDNLPALT